MPKHPHILSAASNLLGIALVIIAALNVAGRNHESFADEVGWAAAFFLSLSCLLSYAAIRADGRPGPYETWADRVFLGGLFLIIASVATLAVENA